MEPNLTNTKTSVFRVESDGFEGVIIGTYTTLEGKEGVVLQQVGTRVVHVYNKKWIVEKKDDVPEMRQRDANRLRLSRWRNWTIFLL